MVAFERIFPVVVARDAEATIELTLASLREFTEVIVNDLGSRDRTREICAAYPNVQVVAGEFLGGGRTRNHAAALADGDWVLALSPGEYLSDALLASLRALDLGDPDAVYSVERHNLFMGRAVRFGGWGPRWGARLYNRHRYQFSDALVDEKLILANDTRIVPLKGMLWREAVPGLDVLVREIGREASLREHGVTRAQSPVVITTRAAWAFFVSYVLKLGLLEGWRGLVIATASSTELFFRLMQHHARGSARARRAANGTLGDRTT